MSSSLISITNSFGVPSRSPAEWQANYALIAGSDRKSGYLPVLSFQGSRTSEVTGSARAESIVEDTAVCARLASEACARAATELLEVNLSCPNEGGTPIFRDRPTAIASLQAIRGQWQGKLIAKLGVLPEAELELFLRESHGLIDAVSLINTVAARVETKDGLPALGTDRPTGGVCGALILEQALRAVERAANLREKLGADAPRVIGVGGIRCAADLQRHLDAGADVAMAATGAMWNLNLAAECADAQGVKYERED